MNALSFAARVAVPVICVVGCCCCRHRLRAADVRYVVKPVAEMKVKQLPKGPLYWRVENFPTLDQAKAAAGEYRWNPDTVSYEGWPSLTAEVAGKAWLFTLGPQGSRRRPAERRWPKSDPYRPYPRPSTCCASTSAADRRGPRHRSIRIRAPKPSTSSPGNWARRRRTASAYVEAGHTMNGHMAGDADGSLQRWHDRSDRPHHVRGGCHQTILGAGQVRLTLPSAASAGRSACRPHNSGRWTNCAFCCKCLWHVLARSRHAKAPVLTSAQERAADYRATP